MGMQQAKLGTKRGSLNGMWKGGKWGGNGDYILVQMKNHPYVRKDGAVLEHRLVMEKHIGRYLSPHEVVHHINEIKHDNRIENLRLMTKREHDYMHLSQYRINQTRAALNK